MDDRSGNEREIEVRSLMGDSIRVSIEPSKTVQDLKLRLKQCFSPAASSPDFHLFFKAIYSNHFILFNSVMCALFFFIYLFINKKTILLNSELGAESNCHVALLCEFVDTAHLH